MDLSVRLSSISSNCLEEISERPNWSLSLALFNFQARLNFQAVAIVLSNICDDGLTAVADIHTARWFADRSAASCVKSADPAGARPCIGSRLKRLVSATPLRSYETCPICTIASLWIAASWCASIFSRLLVAWIDCATSKPSPRRPPHSEARVDRLNEASTAARSGIVRASCRNFSLDGDTASPLATAMSLLRARYTRTAHELTAYRCLIQVGRPINAFSRSG